MGDESLNAQDPLFMEESSINTYGCISEVGDFAYRYDYHLVLLGMNDKCIDMYYCLTNRSAMGMAKLIDIKPSSLICFHIHRSYT